MKSRTNALRKENIPEIRRLYEEDGLTVQGIADRFAVSWTAIYNRLLGAGVKIRPLTHNRKHVDRDLLYDAYVVRGLTLAAAAAELGVSKTKISDELNRFKIPRCGPGGHLRKQKYDLAELKRLYEEEGLTIRQIADRLAIPHQTINQRLVRSGAKMRSHHRRRRYFERDLLYDLYVVRGLTLPVVGTELGAGEQKVRAELKRHGIERRRSGWQRLDAKINLDEIKRLYEEEGLTQLQIAIQYAVSPQTIQKRLKRAGVVARKSRPKPPLDRDLLYELYVVRCLTMAEMATEIKVGKVKISSELRRYKIRRPKRWRRTRNSRLHDQGV